MAKRSAINIEQELLEYKSRLGIGFSEGHYYETISRVEDLERSLNRLGADGDAEMYRHFPVAAIAVLETQFKATVTAIIDQGSPYLERGLSLCKDKFIPVTDTITLLNRKRVTVGDLVSRLLPFNSISSLKNAFDALFDDDFMTMVERVREPHFERWNAEGHDPIIDNAPELWRGLSKTFEIRHVLAHESASKYVVNFEDARQSLHSVAQLTRALNGLLWVTIWKDEPLTQREMNDSAHAEMQEARKRLASRLRKAQRIATEDGNRARFRDLYLSWRHYYRKWILWQDEKFSNGSIAPLLHAKNCTVAFNGLHAELCCWISQMRFGDPPELDF